MLMNFESIFCEYSLIHGIENIFVENALLEFYVLVFCYGEVIYCTPTLH